MFVCSKCGKEFEHRRHMFRHRSKVHPDKTVTDPEGSEPVKQRAGEEGRKRRLEKEGLPGDQWPAKQQLVLTTGNTGDILPWSSKHNIMLLAPSAVCGVIVPRKWTPTMACGALGISRETLKETRKSSGPTLNTLREELVEALRRSCHQPDRSQEKE